MADKFDKWWNDTKKHYKRKNCWLPHALTLKSQVTQERPFRYFTLCAQSMIDVFMLAQERVLTHDPDLGILNHVCFCEYDMEQFAEIGELIGVEGRGFFGKLEELVLFEDDDFSVLYPQLENINQALEDEGLGEVHVDILQRKKIHNYLTISFPYDFINLDFCGYYYPKPPDIWKINKTVERMLEWQLRMIDNGRERIDKFILSVTCRHDSSFPNQATERLKRFIKANSERHPNYREFLEENRQIADINNWAVSDNEDFFLSSWPKEIAQMAMKHQWHMDILEYLYYERTSDAGQPYKIACLVCKFDNLPTNQNDLQIALKALDQNNRKFVPNISRDSDEGRELLANLADIVAVRNRQAQLKNRPILPDP